MFIGSGHALALFSYYITEIFTTLFGQTSIFKFVEFIASYWFNEKKNFDKFLNSYLFKINLPCLLALFREG